MSQSLQYPTEIPTDKIPLQVLDPHSHKTLKPYFAVFSPQSLGPAESKAHADFLRSIESSPYVLCTKEFGINNTHEHFNYLFFHSAKDSFNLKRIYKMKLPEWKVKSVSSINNVIGYMTKEGNISKIHCWQDGGAAAVRPPSPRTPR